MIFLVCVWMCVFTSSVRADLPCDEEPRVSCLGRGWGGRGWTFGEVNPRRTNSQSLERVCIWVVRKRRMNNLCPSLPPGGRGGTQSVIPDQTGKLWMNFITGEKQKRTSYSRTDQFTDEDWNLEKSSKITYKQYHNPGRTCTNGRFAELQSSYRSVKMRSEDTQPNFIHLYLNVLNRYCRKQTSQRIWCTKTIVYSWKCLMQHSIMSSWGIIISRSDCVLCVDWTKHNLTVNPDVRKSNLLLIACLSLPMLNMKIHWWHYGSWYLKSFRMIYTSVL